MSDPLGKPPPSSEITPEGLWIRRRELIRNAALFTATSAGMGGGLLWLMGGSRTTRREDEAPADEPDLVTVKSAFTVDEPQTPYGDVTTYNNFYEFGPEKGDPAAYAGSLRPRPWTIAVDGEVAKPQTIDIDQLLSWFTLVDIALRRITGRTSTMSVEMRKPA